MPSGSPLSLRHWLSLDKVPPGGGPERSVPDEWRRIPRRLWRYQPRPRLILLGRPPDAAPDLHLVVDTYQSELGRSRIKPAAGVSVLLHGLGILWLLSQPVGMRLSEEAFQLALRYRASTTLVAPTPEAIRRLTRPAPAVEEVNLEALLARPGGQPDRASLPAPQPLPAIPSPPITAPDPEVVAVTESEPPPRPIQPPEPPKIAESKESPAVVSPDLPVAAPAAPAAPEEEQTQLAFENVGPMGFSRSRSTVSSGVSSPGRVAIPSVPRAPNSIAQQPILDPSRLDSGGRGVVIGDVEVHDGVVEARQIPPAPNNTGSNIQMISDSEGIDFRPYLIRVLAAVRRNWFAVMPVSAMLGRHGKVVIQFSIDRTGSVPKLVIAVPSGAEPLDRAAVAGVSASNPFPPLPDEFPGSEIRLQLNFSYGVKR